MLVEFKQQWFAPSDVFNRDKLTVVSGTRFRKGTHTVPDELEPFLPSSATILDGPIKVEDAPIPEEFVLRDFDEVRAASDVQAEVQNKVEEEVTKKVRSRSRKVK